MARDFSGSLILRRNKILMFFNEEEDFWDIPSGKRQEGELSADAASRITREFTGCGSEVKKHQAKFKTSFKTEEDKTKLQPYLVDIKGQPERGEWIKKEEITSRNLSPPLQNIGEQLAEKL